MNPKSEYLMILKLFGDVVNSQQGSSPSDERLLYAQALALKFFEHACAIQSLSNGVDTNPIIQKDGTLLGYSSMEVLERSLFECLLTFFYIYIDPPDGDTFEFRYCVWHLRGLIVRERFFVDFPPTDKGSEQDQLEFLNNEFDYIDELRDRIKKTNFFLGIRKEKKRKLVLKEGKWQFPIWIDLSKQAGISPRFSQILYLLLSDQSHSGGLSAIQMLDLSINERNDRMEGTLSLGKLLISKMMTQYLDLFPNTVRVFEANQEVARLVKVNTLALGKLK
jgi:hypothetical protein